MCHFVFLLVYLWASVSMGLFSRCIYGMFCIFTQVALG